MNADEAFGAGLSYDENWDWEISSSGDLRTDSGVSNLKKVIAAAVRRELGEDYSDNLDIDTLADIGIVVDRVLRNDDRINAVRSLNVEAGEETDLVSVNVSLDTPADEIHEDIIIS